MRGRARSPTYALPKAAPTTAVVVRVRTPPVNAKRCLVPVKGQFGQFEFDKVHSDAASQEEVFRESFLPLVNAFIEGGECIALAYGADQTGKSYTLEGSLSIDSDRQGSIPRAVHTICKYLTLAPRNSYQLYATYSGLSSSHEALLYDLSQAGVPPVCLRDVSAAAALQKLMAQPVNDVDDMLQLLRTGRAARAMAGLGNAGGGGAGGGGGGNNARAARTTAMHTMLTLHLAGSNPNGSTSLSRLSFIELCAPEPKDILGWTAGADTGAGRFLAMSYSSLTNVLMALRQTPPGVQGKQASDSAPGAAGVAAQPHVPWRDSPLTRWLYDRLHCASHMLVVATVSGGPEAASETLATLNYASRLRGSGQGAGVVVSATWEEQEGTQNGLFNGRDASPLHYSIMAVHPVHQAAATRYSPAARESATQLRRSSSPHLSPRPVAQPPATSPRGLDSPTKLTLLPRDSASPNSPNGRNGQLPSTYPSTWRLASDASAAMYGELLALLKRCKAGMRGEALLERLLQDLGEARAGLMAERADCRVAKASLAELQLEHQELQRESKVQGELVAELRRELDAVQRRLTDASADRDLFLQRLRAIEQNEIEPARRANETVKQAQDAAAALRQEVCTLTAEKQQLAEQVQKWQGEADALRGERNVLARQNGEMSQRLAGQLSQLNEEAGALKERAAEAVARADAESAAKERALQERDQARAEIKALLPFKDEAAELRVELDNARLALSTVREDRKRLQDVARAATLRAEEVAMQLDGSQEAQQAAAGRVSLLQGEVDKCEARLQELTQQIYVAEQQRRQLRSAQSQLHELESALGQFGADVRAAVAGTQRELQLSDALSVAEKLPEGGPGRWQQPLAAVLEIVRYATAQHNDLQAQNQKLQRQVSKLNSDLEEKTETLADKEALLHQLDSQLRQQRGSTATADQQLAADRKMIESLEQQLHAATASLRALEDDHQRLRAADSSKVMDLQLRDESLRNMEDEKEQLQRVLQAAQATSQQLQGEGQRLKAQLRVREQTLDAAWLHIRDTARQLLTKNSTHSPLLTNPYVAPYSSARGAVTPPAADLHNGPNGPNGHAATALADWNEPRWHQAVLTASAQLKAEVLQLQHELQHAQQGSSHNQELRHQLISAQQECSEMESTLSTLRFSNQALESSNSALSKQLQDANQQVARLGASLSEEKAARQGLQAAARQHEQTAAGLAQQLSSVQQELAVARGALNEEKLARLAAEDRALLEESAKSGLQSQLASLQQALQQCEQRLREAEASRGSLSQQLQQLQLELEAARSAAHEERRARAALQEEVSLANSSKDTWRDAAKRQETQLKETLTELESKRMELTRARAELVDVRTKLESTMHKATTLGRELERVGEAAEAGEKRINELHARLAAAEKESTHLSGVNSKLQVELNDMAANLESAQLDQMVRAAHHRAAESHTPGKGGTRDTSFNSPFASAPASRPNRLSLSASPHEQRDGLRDDDLGPLYSSNRYSSGTRIKNTMPF